MPEATAAVALVTGGGRGIGRHIALALGRAGYRVAIFARSAEEIAQTVALLDEATSLTDATLGITADVTDAASVAEAVATVEARWGAIDLLVNNAGTSSRPSTIADADVDAWWRVVEVNLRGPMLCSRYVLPGMLARGRGRIIAINSLMGADARGAGASSDYAVSKAGLLRFTHVLAAELAGTGVTAFDLSPGLVFTRMTDNPGFAGVPKDQWTDIETAAAAVVRLASGAFDELSGRFLHASDDFDELAADMAQIVARDGRVLAMRLAGPADQLLS